MKRGRKEQKKIPAGEAGSKARGECDLNRLYNSEKEGRKGRCTDDQVHKKEAASTCKTSWFCQKCKVFLHPSALMTTIVLDMVSYSTLSTKSTRSEAAER